MRCNQNSSFKCVVIFHLAVPLLISLERGGGLCPLLPPPSFPFILLHFSTKEKFFLEPLMLDTSCCFDTPSNMSVSLLYHQ